MKKLMLILCAVMLTAGSVYADEAAAEKTDSPLAFSYDLSYMSKWMSRGGEVYSENGAFINTINADLWGTGFTASVGHVSPDGASFTQESGVRPSDKQRFNYFASYTNSLFDDSDCKTSYRFTYMYKDWYNQSSDKADYQVWIFAFAWPKLIGGGLTPKYIAHYDYPAGSGYDNRANTGWIHRFGLDYKFDVEGLPAPVVLSNEVAYRDGYGNKDHDWSHATFGLGTKFKLTDNLSLVPAVYYQITMDNSVNPHDDLTYCKISLKYNF